MVEICKSSELTENQLKNVVDQDEQEVHEVKSHFKKPVVIEWRYSV